MTSSIFALQPGAVVRLADRPEGTYQIVNLDDDHDRCWVRRWPLVQHRSPTFVVAVHQVSAVLEPAC